MTVKTIEVQILGQNYSIKVDEDEAYVKTLAKYVDEKLREVYTNSPTISHFKSAVMASLGIADELFKLRMEIENLSKVIEDKTKVLSGLIE
ncbi:MAG: cell division protein ZapA [Nitrospirae bacterium]|nr:cell division protein ZapA [Nitrospirota bacterium]